MGGKVLTLPSDLIREGREEGIAFGINQGRLNEIFSSVQDGDYREYPKVCVNLQTDVR